MAKYDLEIYKKDKKGKWRHEKTIKTLASSDLGRWEKNRELEKKDGFRNIRIHKEKTPSGYRVIRYSGEKDDEKFIVKHHSHYKEKERARKNKFKR